MAENTITLQQAQEWATRWRSDSKNTVKAYLIPNIDIVQLLDEKSTFDIRAYIGIDENGINRLMLVGVDVDGNDLIDDANGKHIYDFTKPCPSTCDVHSPLYTLK